jgi:hypothetical protein
MPQRAYVPVGSLRKAATYPEELESKDDSEIADALTQAGLGHPWLSSLPSGTVRSRRPQPAGSKQAVAAASILSGSSGTRSRSRVELVSFGLALVWRASASHASAIVSSFCLASFAAPPRFVDPLGR